jgi:hypothetical protein
MSQYTQSFAEEFMFGHWSIDPFAIVWMKECSGFLSPFGEKSVLLEQIFPSGVMFPQEECYEIRENSQIVNLSLYYCHNDK